MKKNERLKIKQGLKRGELKEILLLSKTSASTWGDFLRYETVEKTNNKIREAIKIVLDRRKKQDKEDGKLSNKANI